MIKKSDLADKYCAPGAAVRQLDEEGLSVMMLEFPDWQLGGRQITRSYEFANYHETMAFLNAAAYIAHREDHHPEMQVTYDCCRVTYWTHEVGGLSENDFICAAKLDLLYD